MDCNFNLNHQSQDSGPTLAFAIRDIGNNKEKWLDKIPICKHFEKITSCIVFLYHAIVNLILEQGEIPVIQLSLLLYKENTEETQHN